MIMRQTVQQERAKYALEKIKDLTNPNGSKGAVNQKELLSYVRGLPAMIQTNGLGQAMAFYYSNTGTHHHVYDVVADWLMQSGKPYEQAAERCSHMFLECVVSSDQATYQLAQAEAQALLSWVVKFTQAFAKGD